MYVSRYIFRINEPFHTKLLHNVENQGYGAFRINGPQPNSKITFCAYKSFACVFMVLTSKY